MFDKRDGYEFAFTNKEPVMAKKSVPPEITRPPEADCRIVDRSDKSLERVFAAIRATHAKYPDQRLGQIICNAVPVPGVAGARLFYAENDDLAKLVIAYKGP